jgi:hypothetical protein
MSRANVDLVRRWFEGLERGELSPEICDEEILIRNWDESPIRGPYHGHAVRDGKIVSAIGYASPGRAKKAAGLKRPPR